MPLAPGQCMPRPRIAFYAHDTMGLGHTRRNLALAEALLASPLEPEVLLMGGARETGQLEVPDGADSIILPAIHKDGEGRYRARSLPVSIDRLIRIRAATLHAALGAFRPDLLIVDQVARGALGELEPILRGLRHRPTRTVLGLRDVQDEPMRIRTEWARLRTLDAIRAFYDEVWVYGDRACFDPIAAYRIPADVAMRLRFTGFVARRPVPTTAPGAEVAALLSWAGVHPLALCLVGGGQDGMALGRCFLEAVPPGCRGILVTGPFMPREDRATLARTTESDSRLRVVEFVRDLRPLLLRARNVVAMAGYNTVCELLGAGQRPLLVPRIRPREEQWVRARRLQRLGLADLLHPQSLHPQALSAWLAGTPVPDATALARLDFGGLRRIVHLASSVLDRPRRCPVEEAHAARA